MTGGHACRTEVVVVGTSHSGHGKFVRLEWQCKLLVLCLLVQAADIREAELTRLHVIHRNAIDIDIVVLLVKRTVAEAHRRKEVAHLACVNVVVGVDDGHILRHVVILSELCLSERKCRLVENRAALSNRISGILCLSQRSGA